MTTPHCPHCNAQGLKHLAFEPLAAFALVYCKQCGAIYGAVPCPPQEVGQPDIILPVAAPAPTECLTRPAPAVRPPSALAQLGNADLSLKLPLSPPQLEAETRMAWMFAPGSPDTHMIPDDGPPLCLTHKIEMREMVIPDGYLNAGRRLWICPEYEACQQWAVRE